MILGLLMLFGYCFLMWLIFFKLKLAKFGIPQAVIGVFVGVHLLIIFLIGLRFMTPLATEARIVQHTIQLIPRLPSRRWSPRCWSQPNVPVKKGQPLFQFDRRMYEYKVKQLEAQLAKARQNVLVMKADIEVARRR
jgi:multidrug resistance efflux pump